MAKFRKKSVVIEAAQWWKAGDCGVQGRYFDSKLAGEDLFCSRCGSLQEDHGDLGNGVCPGDWIINTHPCRCLCKPDIFEATYELVTE